MSVIIGSARIDEHGHIANGSAGDQKQTSTPDYKGEVSMQEFYVHRKGWYLFRPKSVDHADKIAERMTALCNNPNYGYNQYTRLDVVKNGIDSKKKGGCDCSSSVRACIKEATGKDVGNFNTGNEPQVLSNSRLFEPRVKYTSGMKLAKGDILVTCSKGHTVIVCQSDYKRSSGSASGTSGSPKSSFQVGKVYTVQVNDLNVRTGAGTSYRKKSRSELTADGRKHADAEGQMKKGTRVTCKEVKTVGNQIWIRTPSGWLCAYNGSKWYVR